MLVLYLFSVHFHSVHIIAAGPSFDNETVTANEPLQYIIVTDANRLSLAVYARDPLSFFQVGADREN